ncbi:hypothetical protein COLO4_25064 [Corchorus olitorius]|uniref:Uncharacterized protein n=1 Tax=Corchorus olitorius TaxID=93759 RepID=A0A1R3I4X0_9ROSI|nr:hypothetical protein COLO4_25064 [Corchorus olitorius]
MGKVKDWSLPVALYLPAEIDLRSGKRVAFGSCPTRIRIVNRPSQFHIGQNQYQQPAVNYAKSPNFRPFFPNNQSGMHQPTMQTTTTRYFARGTFQLAPEREPIQPNPFTYTDPLTSASRIVDSLEIIDSSRKGIHIAPIHKPPSSSASPTTQMMISEQSKHPNPLAILVQQVARQNLPTVPVQPMMMNHKFTIQKSTWKMRLAQKGTLSITTEIRFQTQHKRCNPPFHLKDHRNTKANLDPAQRCIQERGARQQNNCFTTFIEKYEAILCGSKHDLKYTFLHSVPDELRQKTLIEIESKELKVDDMLLRDLYKTMLKARDKLCTHAQLVVSASDWDFLHRNWTSKITAGSSKFIEERVPLSQRLKTRGREFVASVDRRTERMKVHSELKGHERRAPLKHRARYQLGVSGNRQYDPVSDPINAITINKVPMIAIESRLDSRAAFGDDISKWPTLGMSKNSFLRFASPRHVFLVDLFLLQGFLPRANDQHPSFTDQKSGLEVPVSVVVDVDVDLVILIMLGLLRSYRIYANVISGLSSFGLVGRVPYQSSNSDSLSISQAKGKGKAMPEDELLKKALNSSYSPKKENRGSTCIMIEALSARPVSNMGKSLYLLLSVLDSQVPLRWGRNASDLSPNTTEEAFETRAQGVVMNRGYARESAHKSSLLWEGLEYESPNGKKFKQKRERMIASRDLALGMGSEGEVGEEDVLLVLLSLLKSFVDHYRVDWRIVCVSHSFLRTDWEGTGLLPFD